MKEATAISQGVQPYELADVSQEEQNRILEVVSDWLQRMVRISIAHHGSTSDYLIVCPVCDATTLEYSKGVWHCVFGACHFRFPTDFTPPPPVVLEKFLQRIREENEIKNLFCRTGVKLPS